MSKDIDVKQIAEDVSIELGHDFTKRFRQLSKDVDNFDSGGDAIKKEAFLLHELSNILRFHSEQFASELVERVVKKLQNP